MRPDKRAITLIELVISIILLGMVVLGFYGIDLFSRNQLLGSDRRAKVQNEAMYVMGHVSKHLLQAIGDMDNPPVIIASTGTVTKTLTAKMDTGDGIWNSPPDYNIAYCYNSVGCNAPAVPYQISFNNKTAPLPMDSAEVLASHVHYFNATLNGGYVNLTITTCWDPSQTTKPCGSIDNPTFNMQSTIKMPSVSAQ